MNIIQRLILVTLLVGSSSTVAATLQPRIIGGIVSVANGWPSVVSLQLVAPSGTVIGPFCGGNLIASKWVLTAAHCMFDDAGKQLRLQDLQVLIGTNRVDTSTGGEFKPVANIFVHPSFNPKTFDADLALLELAYPVEYSSMAIYPVAPVAYPNVPESRALATVVGWGATAFANGSPVASSFSAQLREVEVPVITNELCQSVYAGLTRNMLCAGYADGGKDSCAGDSGGPLMVRLQSGEYQQAGIISTGNGCAQRDAYGIYTRTANYLTWINIYTNNAAPKSNPVAASGSGSLAPIGILLLALAGVTRAWRSRRRVRQTLVHRLDGIGHRRA
ncbi:MAG: S1 family serine peptidase [Thiotrichales bacterium]